MAYAPHTLVAFGGDWTNEGGEVWECTLRVGEVSGSTWGPLSDPAAFMAAKHDALGTWFSTGAHNTSEWARLKWLKVNNLDAAGHYVGETNVYDYPAPVVGESPAQGPQFVSLAYSFTSNDFVRGPGARGRMYPPNATFVPFTAMQVAQSDAQANANAAYDLLNVFTDTGTIAPVLASRVDARISSINATAISSDTIYDTIRRRKNRVSGFRKVQNVV